MSSPFPPSDPFKPGGQQPPSYGSGSPYGAAGGTPAPFPPPYSPTGMPPPYSYQPAPATSLLAVFSLLLGGPFFLACCCWFVSLPLSIGAIATGHMALINIHRSEGRLGGKVMAIFGLIGGYLGLLLAIMMMVFTFFGSSTDDKVVVEDDAAAETAEELLSRAETKIISDREGIAHGNTPEAVELAKRYSELIQELRDNLFTKGEGGISLSGGKFITYCELREGQCAFVVHVPEYRKFEGDAKESLADLSWLAARNAVADTLEPGDRLAVGLKGIALYGSVKVGKVVDDESEEDGIETEGKERKNLLPFFVPEKPDEPSTDLEVDAPEEAMPAEEGTDDTTPPDPADPFGSPIEPVPDDAADPFGSPAPPSP